MSKPSHYVVVSSSFSDGYWVPEISVAATVQVLRHNSGISFDWILESTLEWADVDYLAGGLNTQSAFEFDLTGCRSIVPLQQIQTASGVALQKRFFPSASASHYQTDHVSSFFNKGNWVPKLSVRVLRHNTGISLDWTVESTLKWTREEQAFLEEEVWYTFESHLTPDSFGGPVGDPCAQYDSFGYRLGGDPHVFQDADVILMTEAVEYFCGKFRTALCQLIDRCGLLYGTFARSVLPLLGARSMARLLGFRPKF